METPDFSRLRNPDRLDHPALDRLGTPLGLEATHRAARQTFPRHPDHARAAFRLLQRYALNRAIALRLKAAGYPECAREYEMECERLYLKLPPFAQWRRAEDSSWKGGAKRYTMAVKHR